MRGVIYARYSSDNQREESNEGQIRECKVFAERNGIDIIGSYIDRAFSAKTDNRPDFQRMIKDSASKTFDIVLVWKLDRFARDRYDSAYYKRVLRKNCLIEFKSEWRQIKKHRQDTKLMRNTCSLLNCSAASVSA